MTGSITIAGKEYISAIRASKKIDYSADYIGQLCRGKKIPATLIGKTWYVDYEALTKYKKTKKIKGHQTQVLKAEVVEKPLDKIEEKDSRPSPTQPLRGNISEVEKLKIPNNVVITYEKDDQPRLPELSKITEKTPAIPTKKEAKKSAFKIHLIPAALVLMIFFGFAVTKLENLSLNPINSMYREVSSSVTSSLQPALLATVTQWFKDLFGPSSDGSQLAEETSGNGVSQNSGIVVVPATDDRESVVARIKNAFSDNVEVSFDQSGDTGTITPVFRESDEFENYAFVIVPLKDSSNN